MKVVYVPHKIQTKPLRFTEEKHLHELKLAMADWHAMGIDLPAFEVNPFFYGGAVLNEHQCLENG